MQEIKDFTDDIAKEFLARNYDIQKKNFNYPELINKFIY